MTRLCLWCKELFETTAHGGSGPAKFCSNTCRHACRVAKGFGYSRLDPEPSPDVWDGRTTYSEVVPPARDYYLSCMLCSRQVALKLTDAEAKLLRPRRCDNCGSRLLLELDAGRATQPSTPPTVRRPNPVLAETRI